MHVRNAHVRRAAPSALTALAAAALAASVLTSPALAAPAPAVDIPAPAAGTCWNYTYKQASASFYTGRSVECTEPHTLETVATLDVPKEVAAKGLKSRDLVLWLDQRCQVEVNRYAGVATPEIAAPGSRTWYFWYAPTPRQWKAGERWVSCAAASVPTDEAQRKKFVVVTDSIAQAASLSKPITFKTEYGTGTYLYRKPMTALAGRPWPGSSGLQKKAASFCEKELGHKKFFWYGPDETQWVAGYTAVRCYSLKKS